MLTREFTIDDLRRVLRAAAGEVDGVDLDADILDVPFDTLGYDSLALLETGSRIGRERGIELADSTISDAATPRALLASVNEQLALSGQPSNRH
jgi:act minimal PKS acyl carrier protein